MGEPGSGPGLPGFCCGIRLCVLYLAFERQNGAVGLLEEVNVHPLCCWGICLVVRPRLCWAIAAGYAALWP